MSGGSHLGGSGRAAAPKWLGCLLGRMSQIRVGAVAPPSRPGEWGLSRSFCSGMTRGGDGHIIWGALVGEEPSRALAALGVEWGRWSIPGVAVGIRPECKGFSRSLGSGMTRGGAAPVTWGALDPEEPSRALAALGVEWARSGEVAYGQVRGCVKIY